VLQVFVYKGIIATESDCVSDFCPQPKSRDLLKIASRIDWFLEKRGGVWGSFWPGMPQSVTNSIRFESPRCFAYIFFPLVASVACLATPWERSGRSEQVIVTVLFDIVCCAEGGALDQADPLFGF
jgi:hypothetical protein